MCWAIMQDRTTTSAIAVVRATNNEAVLTGNIRYECGVAKKQQVCPLCGKKYTRPEYVREHFSRRHPTYHDVLWNE